MIRRLTGVLLAMSLACCSIGCSSVGTHVTNWPAPSFYPGTQRAVTGIVKNHRFMTYFGQTEWTSMYSSFLFLDLASSAIMDTVLLPLDGILWLFWSEESTGSSDHSAEQDTSTSALPRTRMDRTDEHTTNAMLLSGRSTHCSTIWLCGPAASAG